MRTPLAWKNLTSSWNKCLLASAGVGFAVVLMFMQIGFRNALIDSNVQLFTLFNLDVANVAVTSRARYSIGTEQRFPSRILDAIAALPEVGPIASINVERGSSQVRVAGRPAKPIRVVSVDSIATQWLVDPGLREKVQRADAIDRCLVDSESKSFFGFATSEEALKEQTIELNGQRIAAAGFFRLGTDFANDGTLLMSDRKHAAYFPWRWPTRRPGETVDLALLHVQPAPGETLESVAKRIRSIAPDQIDALPTEALVEREKTFWKQATPIGKIFLIGTLMGLIVGAIICYQIQFTDISDHMSEFATLRAMGYGTMYFWRFILTQSFLLACLGFLPGLVASYLLYQLLASYSGLIMMLSWQRILLVLGLTIAMCVASGAFAIRKLFGTDPANLF